MLNKNLKTLRKAQGLSQEALAIRLNVVRQTVSKWEKGLSVPDAEMFIKIADALETSVGTLLGAPVSEHNKPEDMNLLAKRLDELNEIFTAQMEKRRRIWRMLFIVLGILSMITCVQGIFHCVHWYQSNNALNSNTAIIGGADGPTSIYVSNISLWWHYLLLNGLIATLSVVGLIKTRRR